jgi:ABC-type branched-subunit amino acid transport system substrate-binding protein
MVGTYSACALLVKKARASGFTPQFLSLSFVGTRDFIEASGPDAEGVMITQVMPAPDNTQLAIVRQYQLDMKAAGYKQLDYTSLEGYVNAAVFAEALKASGPELTRKGFVAALEKLNVNLSGLAVAFGSNQHQGLQQVYLTRVRGGKAVAVTKLQAQLPMPSP